MKTLLLSTFLLTASTTFSQQTHFDNLPVHEGQITEASDNTTIPSHKLDGVLITSKNDSCFSTDDAVVISTFDLGGEYVATLKTAEGMFVTYAHLSKTAIKRGEEIRKGTFLGQLVKEGDDYELLYMLSNGKGQFLTRDKHISHLQSSSGK